MRPLRVLAASLRVLAASLRVLAASLRVLPASLRVLAASLTVLTATTAAAQSLDQRGKAAATAAVTWVGYRVPMVSGPRQMCCYDNITNGTVMGSGTCRLESGSGVSMNSGDAITQNGTRVMLES